MTNYSYLTSISSKGESMNRKKAVEKVISLQEESCRFAAELREGRVQHTDSTSLYTLVFELVEVQDQQAGKRSLLDAKYPTVKLRLLPEDAVPESTVLLYEYVELRNSTSEEFGTTLFLLLEEASFTRKPIIRQCTIMMYGFFGHAVHILPPSPQRRPCIILPPEVLRMIFTEASGHRPRESWRKNVISWALVCRSWETPALEYLYEDFSDGTIVDWNALKLADIAKSLKINESLGRMIRTFNADSFLEVTVSGFPESPVVTSLLEILQTAPLIRSLSVPGIPHDWASQLIAVICQLNQNLQTLTIKDPKHRWREEEAHFYSTVTTEMLAKLFSRIPTLRTIDISLFLGSEESEVLSALPVCSLLSLTLDTGTLPLSHLQYLTSSSLSSLKVVVLKGVLGLSNKDLGSWFTSISGNLKHLELAHSKFPKKDEDEPFAVETHLSSMNKLEYLHLDDGMFSSVIFDAYRPEVQRETAIVRGRRRTLILDRNGGIPLSLSLLADKLSTTQWEYIDIRGVGEIYETQEAKQNEVRAIAEKRGIWFMFNYYS